MASATIFALLAILLAPQLVAAGVDELLTPLLSPALDNVCKEVDCGRGTCKPSSNSTFLFSCECDSGWQQTRSDDDHLLGFLPCVIPNCTLDYSCSESVAPPIERKLNPANYSIFDPCNWAYCGGGSCNKTSDFRHSCECNTGYYNLMNTTSFPCFSECTIGMDCSRLGITLTNKSASSTPSVSVGSEGNVCKEVDCGRGTCKPSSNSTFLFSCECDPGWRQTRSKEDRLLTFLPCVIPNCTLDYSCSGSAAPPIGNKANPANYSIFDPCNWAYCGGGSCNKTSDFRHSCECNTGYYNLMNTTSFPCFSECTIGMDCSRLGITLTNNSASSAPSAAEGSEGKTGRQVKYGTNVFEALVPLISQVT